MSRYVDKALIEGERVVHWGVPSLWAFSKPLAVAALTALAGLWAIKAGHSSLGTYLLVVPPNILLYVWMIVSSIELAVTDKRVLAKTGIVQRETSELYLTRIEGVEVDQSLTGRMLGFGTIRIRGTGDQVAVIPTISDPLGFRRALFAAGDKLHAQRPGSEPF